MKNVIIYQIGQNTMYPQYGYVHPKVHNCECSFCLECMVKVYLLQGGKKISKKKTAQKRGNKDLIFNEAMMFSVPANVLQVL